MPWLRRYLPVLAGVAIAAAVAPALLAWLAPEQVPDRFAADAALPPIPEQPPRKRRAPRPAATVAAATVVLQGCWQGHRADGTRIDERYALAADGSLVGKVVETAPDGSVAFFEDLSISAAADGIRYHPRPNGEPRAVSFKLATWDAGHAAFVAPEHDFPQQILFRRDGAALATEVSGVERGVTKRDAYRSEPVACSAG
jgi:hypothetical protein